MLEKLVTTIALIDSNWEGHHPTYFKHFTKTLLELDCQVIAFCPHPDEVLEWVFSICPNLIRKLFVFKIDAPLPSYFPIARFRKTITAIDRWQLAHQAIQCSLPIVKKVPDLVFFACLDDYLGPYLTSQFVDRIFSYYWSGLYFHPLDIRVKQRFSKIRYGPFNHQAILKSTYCKAFGVLDEGAIPRLKEKLPSKSIIIFPDFTDESPPNYNSQVIQKLREKIKSRKVIGLLGALGKRKGLITLIEVAQLAKQKEWFFVFAGKLTNLTFTRKELTFIKAFVESNPDNCLFYFKHIPEEQQFNALVSECDLLFAAYESFPYSSNLLNKAAVLKKPIIVSQGFCMAERVEEFSLGLTVPEGNVSAIFQAIQILLDQTENHSFFANFDKYNHCHSVERIKDAIKSIAAVYSSQL